MSKTYNFQKTDQFLVGTVDGWVDDNKLYTTLEDKACHIGMVNIPSCFVTIDYGRGIIIPETETVLGQGAKQL